MAVAVDYVGEVSKALGKIWDIASPKLDLLGISEVRHGVVDKQLEPGVKAPGQHKNLSKYHQIVRIPEEAKLDSSKLWVREFGVELVARRQDNAFEIQFKLPDARHGNNLAAAATSWLVGSMRVSFQSPHESISVPAKSDAKMYQPVSQTIYFIESAGAWDIGYPPESNGVKASLIGEFVPGITEKCQMENKHLYPVDLNSPWFVAAVINAEDIKKNNLNDPEQVHIGGYNFSLGWQKGVDRINYAEWMTNNDDPDDRRGGGINELYFPHPAVPASEGYEKFKARQLARATAALERMQRIYS